ncbi:MAG: HAD hydrolase-like protein [Bacteroidales bacterium]|nr:HAD hydrolase-like protein [Bacteroidales bacterium]
MNFDFFKNIKLIIWDWNGTLLNDVDICVDTMNQLLVKYGYPVISVEKYREIFSFPVKDYYLKAGFDFEKHSFDVVGMEYISIYNENFSKTKLLPNAEKVLDFFYSKNIKQIIISARENDALQKDIFQNKIGKYFDEVKGISNHYAAGKAELFEDFFSENSIERSEVVLIGDTVHDCEIAKQFGLNFIQFANGHQSKSHFSGCEIISIDDLSELINTNDNL